MKDREPAAEAEIEGGGTHYFFVCGECHGIIGAKDRYCSHCRRRILWTGFWETEEEGAEPDEGRKA